MGKSTRCFRLGIFIVLAFACALFAGACGTSSTGHDGGTDGGVCTLATDCLGTDSDCATRTCLQGQCGIKYAAQGTATTTQTIGDCKKNVCDGSGQTISVSDDTDLPDDHNLCTTDTCKNGTPTYTPVTTGTSCGNGQVCDATGHCVGCVVATSCPGQDTECQTRTCKGGTCGFDFKPNGTVTTAQTAGDCKKKVCDGAGNITNINDDTDLPDDQNVCTDDVCTNGQASNPNKTKGTTCGTNLVCDGNGVCVGCNLPGDCPGTDTDCKKRDCNSSHQCVPINTAAGTPVSQQTAGDCQEVQCDGTGGTKTVADDTDKPVDTNPCTDDKCNSGVPSNPPTTAHTACTPTTPPWVCDGAGTCVECLQWSECSGQSTFCATRTCTNHACDWSYTTAGTKLPDQTGVPACHSDVCDGTGGDHVVVDDNVLPDDGLPCTNDICTNGQASHTNMPVGTQCGTVSNMVCDANGNCVGCNQPADCGQDTECLTNTCVSSVCGVIYTPIGTPLIPTDQVIGDCQLLVCDGAGNIDSQEDDTDLPIDGNVCTDDVCTTGFPTNPPVPAETPCGNSQVCNGNGNCVDCVSPSDCPGVDNECQSRTCLSNLCGMAYVPDGTKVAQQTAGDCHSRVCDGNGNTITIVDDTDVPVDGIQCTGDICTNGVASNPPLPIGTLCTENNGTVCDGAGNCVACNVPSDCPGQDTECQARTCPSNLCDVAHTPAGTPLSVQTTGDCQEVQCDGSGGTMSVADNTDVPNDNNPCTDDICTNGQASNPFVPADTPCGTSQVCDGSGHCVGCVQPSDCAGVDDECKTRTCVANVCDWSYTAPGTPVSSQTAGDCHENVCDGSGNTIIIINDADVPVDGKQCTADICSSGQASNPPLPAGTACSQSGGTVCDGSGNCVQCNLPTDCPGNDTECQARSCQNNLCGVTYTPPGTPVSTQIPGDCHKNVCDGSGHIISVIDNTDLPVDGNQCTNDICTNGQASNPVLPSGTACNQLGGWVCNATAQCVRSLAVVRVGTGAGGLNGNATAVFLEERFLNGTLVPKAGNPVALPTIAAGINAQCTLAGNGITEGALALSVDNHFLSLTCYAANVGTNNVAGTTSAATNRVVARVDSKYNVNTSSRLNTAFNRQAVVGAASSDGTAFWASGNGNGTTGGIWYLPLGATGGTWLLANPTNTRVPAIFGNQLYLDSTVNIFTNPFAVGVGLPTIPGQTARLLPGMSYTGFSPSGYAMLDLNGNVAGVDTLYVALDGGNTPGVEKWTFDGTNWSPTAFYNNGLGNGIGVRGLTAAPSGNNVAVFGTTTEATRNRLVVIVDDGTANPPATVLQTTPANTVYRGVALMAH